MAEVNRPIAAIVPAAGVGKRMLASCPKQYLTINELTILEHTVLRLLEHSSIELVVIALGRDDEYFADTQLANHPKVKTVVGGKERVDSVLAGLQSLDTERFPWTMVHDAARPCVSVSDIDNLITTCLNSQVGGLLAAPVRDTMKRSDNSSMVLNTECRENLWHALTPQMYKSEDLIDAITKGLETGVNITDESSAIEAYGLASQLVAASQENIKITHPDDLALAEFILTKQQEA